MEKLESRVLFLDVSFLVCCKMALFKEEFDQPQSHDEEKRTGMQLWSYDVPSMVSSVFTLLCSFFLSQA